MRASRAAWIGGVHTTSNVAAGRKWNIPVKDTHAHSWVIVFDTEEEALVPYIQKGVFLPPKSLHEARKNCLEDKSKFDPSILRFENPHLYPASMEKTLAQKREEMVYQKHFQGEKK